MYQALGEQRNEKSRQTRLHLRRVRVPSPVVEASGPKCPARRAGVDVGSWYRAVADLAVGTGLRGSQGGVQAFTPPQRLISGSVRREHASET